MPSRADMIKWLLNHDKSWKEGEGYYHFAWNVKMNFPLDWTGWEGERDASEGIEHEWDERWGQYCESKSNYLYDWLIEDVRQWFGLGDDQDFSTEHSGHDDAGDWEFFFVGRSGGWLVLNKWRGNRLEGCGWTELRDWLNELDDEDLSFFYNAISEMDEEFSKKNIRRAANMCITQMRAGAESMFEKEAIREDEEDKNESVQRSRSTFLS